MPVLVAFVGAYIVGFGLFGALTGRPETPVYLIVMIAAVVLVLSIHERVGLSAATLWAFAVWGAAHMAGGLIPTGPNRVLYNTLIGPEPFQYDRFVHAFGYAIASVVAWKTILRHSTPVARAPWGLAIIAGLAGMGVGLLNEVAELAMTKLGAHNVGGYANLAGDLAADALGCCAVTVWIRMKGRTTQLGRLDAPH